MIPLPYPPPSGFDGFVFESPVDIPGVRSQIPVYVTGPPSRPAVIVFHEAGGMSPSCVDLARDLAADGGFRVFLPLLFGKPNQERRSGMDVRGVFCVRREIKLLAGDATSPITGMLRHLVVDVAGRTGHPKVGVIGMCLTGNLVFALMAESNVHAAVTSQPAVPIVTPIRWLSWMSRRHRKSALGVSDADLASAVRSGTPLLALRFEGDVMCPVERFETLADSFESRDLLSIDQLPGDAHSVLTVDRTRENDRVPKVREFLARHLAD
jgi:dienelactone hydrolase